MNKLAWTIVGGKRNGKDFICEYIIIYMCTIWTMIMWDTK